MLLTAGNRLSRKQLARLDRALATDDPTNEIGAAWACKELLRQLLAEHDPPGSGEPCGGSTAPAPRRTCPNQPTRDHDRDLVASHPRRTHRAGTNGPTEAVNLLVEKIRRIGHGYRRFDHYRLRLLLHCGIEWPTLLPPRIRRRRPRFGDVEPLYLATECVRRGPPGRRSGLRLQLNLE